MRSKKFSVIVVFQIYLFLFLSNETIQSCQKDKPILKDGQCVSQFCTKEQFDSGECQIDNEIIKTQWLNNIIYLEISNLRFVNFASYSNGDMIFQPGAFPKTTIRYFIGFKKNGRGLFTDKQTNESSYYYSIEVNQGDQYAKLESQNIVIKLSGNENNNKEYLISIPNSRAYVEIYDFENGIIYQKVLKTFADQTDINSYQHVAISLFSNNFDYYYLFGFIGNKDSNRNTYLFQRHKFNSIENFENENTINFSKFYIKAISNAQTGFSCFKTEKQIIICFFLTYEMEYIITAFDTDLNEKKSITLPYTSLNFNETFYKCAHLKKEIGVFSYFKNFQDEENPKYYPVILFKEYQDTETGIDLINYAISEIILNKINSDLFIFLNDLITINENKLCFFSTSSGSKNRLSIILINLFGEQKYKIRYYTINLNKLYGLTIHMQLRAHNYNNFVSVAFSFHSQYIEKCDNENYEKCCSTLLIFSYPNSTDSKLLLDEYLHNNLTLNDIEINLEDKVRIENNIFGYEFLGIEINNLINCKNLIIMTTLYNDNIYLNYVLQKNELIKLKFSGTGYKAFICTLQYNYKVTESKLEVYDIYPNMIDGYNETNEDIDFKKEVYTGRLTYLDIILNEDLSTNCNDDINCAFCFDNNKNVCLECKYNFTYFEDGKKNCSDKVEEITSNIYSDQIIFIDGVELIKREIKENKEQLVEVENLKTFMSTVEIGKNYEMEGEDFNIIIKPTNTSIPYATHIDFSSCENILRSHYKIDDSRIITFFQLELNDKNEQSLINQVGYQAYDDERNPLNLSLCNDTNIQVFYLIKSNSSLDLSFVSSFKDSNIDIFNIKDDFFNDICISYADSGNDVILDDRISDIYQNYSFCEDGCTYNESNLELMLITCDCKVKENLATNLTDITLVQKDDLDKSSPFEIIKCYKLVFSGKNKSNNAGFILFTILVLLHIPLLVLYFYKGIGPIKEYLEKEMIDNGYIDNNKKRKSKKSLNIDIYKIRKSRSKIKSKTTLENKVNYPPKKRKKSYKKNIIENESNLNDKDKIKTNDNISLNRMMNKDNKIIVQINNIINKGPKINKGKKKKRKAKIIENPKSPEINKKNGFKSLSQLNIKESGVIKNNNDNNLNTIKGKENELNDENNINLHLIKINLNRRDITSIKSSNYILNIYTFDEAIEYDSRSLFRIFYIYILTKQAFFHAFLFKSPLSLFPLRLCLLIFIVSSDLALNAIFYFDNKISEKYRIAGSLFLFAFSNNLIVIFLSTLIGFVLLTLFTKLSNATNAIREVFKIEEEKLKNDKNYKVTYIRKEEIKNEIENIIKLFKIKVIIFFSIEFILMLFFWYYATVFCHVYSSTQISWLWDSFLSMLSRIIIDLLLSLGFSKLYRIAVVSNIKCLYNISLFFYSFGN